jgi:hypothetical protein
MTVLTDSHNLVEYAVVVNGQVKYKGSQSGAELYKLNNLTEQERQFASVVPMAGSKQVLLG